jgi:hypothetical protein
MRMRRVRGLLWLAGLVLPVALGVWAIDRRLGALARAIGLDALARAAPDGDCLA